MKYIITTRENLDLGLQKKPHEKAVWEEVIFREDCLFQDFTEYFKKVGDIFTHIGFNHGINEMGIYRDLYVNEWTIYLSDLTVLPTPFKIYVDVRYTFNIIVLGDS